MARIAVLGAGVAGLATAIRLAKHGHKVQIYEKNSLVGGKVGLVGTKGFRWDSGPSFFTDPDELLDVFGSDNDRRQLFDYYELDEACRYFYEDGTVLRGYDTPENIALELERCFSERPSDIIAFLKEGSSILQGSGKLFTDHEWSLSKLARFTSLRKLFAQNPALVFRAMHSNHTRRFSNPKTVAFFDRFATYNGSNPYKAPALFSSLPALEHAGGAYQPKGGMRAIIDSLYTYALRLGVSIHCESEAYPFIRDGECRGIEHNGQKKRFEYVVTAGDIISVLDKVDTKRAELLKKREHSASAYVLYLGVKQPKKEIYLHNILFSSDYERECHELWQERRVPDEPTIYINNTSYLEASHAPAGHQNWFVMINVPPKLDDTALEGVRDKILARISSVLGENVEEKIIAEATSLTPMRLYQQYNSYMGSIYGLASNSFRGAFLRPKNKDIIPGLYHVGVTVHPGGGIPLALRSARIVSEQIGAA